MSYLQKVYDQKKQDLENYIIEIGKYKGKSLKTLKLRELDSYLAWIEEQKTITHNLHKLKGVLTQYLTIHSADLERKLDENY